MQLVGAKSVSAVIAGHLWLIVAVLAAPAALASITAIVLVLSVERGKRVEAIKALPPVISEINKSRLGSLAALRDKADDDTDPLPRYAETRHFESVPGPEQRRVKQE
jgi:hypothetical protein